MKEDKYALYIVLSEGYGGAERRLIRIYNQLAIKKDIDLIIRRVDRCKFDKMAQNGDINLENFKSIKCFSKTFFGYIRCLLWFIKHKYISVHFFDYSFSFVILSKVTRSKLICTIANYEFDNKKHLKDFERLLPLCNYVDLLFPNKLSIVKKIATDKDIFTTPGSFTDLYVFYPKQKRKVIVFSAARLEESKNPMLLINAAMICKEELRKNAYTIIVLGQNFLEEKIKSIVKENALNDIIKLYGYVKTSEILPYASVITSLQKLSNYPSQSLIEGISCGCYVIATNTGDTDKMVDNSFSTLINDNEKELAEALVNYMNMADDEKKICMKQARSFAEKNFTIDKSLKYFDHILNLCS